MARLDETGLRKRMAEGELSGLFVVAGEEKYVVRRLARQLIKKAGGEAFPEFNSQAFSNESSVDAIADAAFALPFFAPGKCVSVADFNVDEKPADEGKKLYQLLEERPETTALVFWYPTLDWEEKKGKWKKFAQEADRLGTLVLCGRRGRGELVRFLCKEAEKAGVSLGRPAGERLLEYVGEDLTALKSELDKLCAYALATAGGRPPEITRQTVEDLTPKSTETTAFLLAGALVAGEYGKAYTLLDGLFYQNEKATAILGALAASYVDMYRVRVAAEKGLPYEEAAPYGDYKGKAFRLKKAHQNSRRLSKEVLRKSLHLLLDADMALKGSPLEERIVLEELIAKLLAAAQEDNA